MNLQEDAKLFFMSVIFAYQNSMIYFAQNMSFPKKKKREKKAFDREQCILKCHFFWSLQAQSFNINIVIKIMFE